MIEFLILIPNGVEDWIGLPRLCRHAVSYFVEPLLEQWDRQKLEITLYACGEQFDDYSARLQAKADRWVNLQGQE